jgi:hypothetical protein
MDEWLRPKVYERNILLTRKKASAGIAENFLRQFRRTMFKPDPAIHNYQTNLEYFNVQ